MTYVHLTLANVIDSPEVSRPTELVRLDGKGIMVWSEYITAVELAQCGWYTVRQTARPADTATATYDRSIVYVAGQGPVETWTQRLKTQAELDADAATANSATIRQQANTALDSNRTYLAIASPTNAQVVAQVRALTQQMNGVIRLVLGKLDGAN